MTRIIYLLIGVFVASPVAHAATVEDAVSISPTIDADNPFTKSLQGSRQGLLSPEMILQELNRLNSITSETVSTVNDDKISRKEFLEIKEVIDALKAPAPPADYLETESLPLRARPVNEYELRGVIVSYEEDPTGHRFIDTSSANRQIETVHVVRNFETVERLSQFYGVSISELLTANGLSKEDVLFEGMALIIPQGTVKDNQLLEEEYSLLLGAFEGHAVAKNFIASAKSLYGDLLEGDRFAALENEAGKIEARVGQYQDQRVAESKCALIAILDGDCTVVSSALPSSDSALKRNRKRYTAIVGIAGQTEEYFVSEGDFLGKTAAVVVSISERQLILQNSGSRTVLSLDQDPGTVKVSASVASSSASGPVVACSVLQQKYSSAPDVTRLCAAGPSVQVSCDSLDLATKVGVAECN